MPHDVARTLGSTAGVSQAGATLHGVGLAPAWSREDWISLADRMLTSVRPYASPGHARITLPGAEGGYGHAIDGLEGFARTFLLAGFRIAGERSRIAREPSSIAGEPNGIAADGGAGLDELAEWYAAGIAAGTDPHSPERWVRLDEHGQAKVEAASIALILDMTRPWIWDRLSPLVQEQVVDYLAPAVGDATYPRINWVWFRLVVQTFLRSVGGPWSAGDMAEDLATHDGFARADGWMSDGAERSYDHYVGWALHLYPALWARMAGAADLAAVRRERDVAMLDRFLQDAVALVGADGSPLIQGRSLIYRFAAAAPFWVGALAGVPSLSPGLLRRAATGVVAHFADHGAPDERGVLTMGWHDAWRRLAQSYSGPSSPYWASKGMLGIALPADHPVWHAEPEELPVERGEVLRAVRAPGWLIYGTRADGIVRVINHGTDHAEEGATGGDSPLYARLGYSTATCPVLDESGWTAPEDQSVTLIDRAGRPSHRTGMRTLAVGIRDGDGGPVGLAGSVALAHWVDTESQAYDHGSGRIGTSRPAGRITVFSLVRGPWELRLTRADDVDPSAVRLRIGGWPVAGAGGARTSHGEAIATGDGLLSRVRSIAPGAETPGALTAGVTGAAGVTEHADGGPLARPVRVPWLDHPATTEGWILTLVELAGAGDHGVRLSAGDQDGRLRSFGQDTEHPCRAALAESDGHLDVHVDWPDGTRTRTRLHTVAPRDGRLGNPVAVRAQRRAPILKEKG